VNLFLRTDADVNFLNRGTTPLINAVINGDTSIVTNLIAHGADVSIRDSHNMTAKEVAERLHLDQIGKIIEEASPTSGHH